tara:strand:- start:4324 stop:4545 length:222 start_codon:yes stop_codon:yes gene_type:complete
MQQKYCKIKQLIKFFVAYVQKIRIINNRARRGGADNLYINSLQKNNNKNKKTLGLLVPFFCKLEKYENVLGLF